MKKAITLILLAVVIAGAAIYWWVASFCRDLAERDPVVWEPGPPAGQPRVQRQRKDRNRPGAGRGPGGEGAGRGHPGDEEAEATAAQAKAKVEAQRHVLDRLENGSRPEEIDQARANVNAAKADLTNTRLNYERLKKSAGGGATSQQDLDAAKAAFEVAEAKLRVNQKALDLAVIGPRQEDIAEARATLLSNEAGFAVSMRDLAYATLVSPTNGVVQNRILEPGEMASPQRAVLTIAITDPKWVRVYAEEPDLGKIRMGMAATVTTDSFPGKKYDGWVGFISPVASFTPKTVETTDCVRRSCTKSAIFVKDPADELRLGMPATVRIPLTGMESNNGGSATENRGG